MDHFMNSSDFYAEGKDNSQYIKKYELTKADLRNKNAEWENLASQIIE
jgi:hypothetical protein